MKNTGFLLFIVLFCCRAAFAAEHVNADSLLIILQQKNGPQKEKQLILSLRYYYSGRPQRTLAAAKRQLDSLLAVFPVPDAQAVSLFAETMYRMELKQYEQAETALVRAIALADTKDDHYLLYGCFIQLAFLQNLKGNTTAAVTSFREARKVASRLSDGYLQVLVDINISDIYYRNKLHGESLVYLDQAVALIKKQHLAEPSFTMMILENKAENYFSMGKTDSLAKYSRQLLGLSVPSARLYTFQQRSLYTLDILRRQYDRALNRLEALKKDSLYWYDATDAENLAQTLFQAGRLDSAGVIARQLTSDPAQRNHPEVTLPLNEMLARIALAAGDKDQAIRRFDDALQQAKLQITRLIEVDTIAARLKLDEMQSGYVRREEAYGRERLWLVFSVITAGLVLAAGAVLYRNIRQKRELEKLLYDTRRDELSFMHSHEVRRHLSNILGIMDTIRHSEDRHLGYLEAEAHLMQAAENLDSSIRHISDKLNG